MHSPPTQNRRRALKTLFCSSSWLALNLKTDGLWAKDEASSKDGLHILMVGDFGTTGEDQRKVAAAMRKFAKDREKTPDCLFLLGDNFYSKAKDGFSLTSERWRTTFEEVYPEIDFPGSCHAILGNHDYHDNPGGEKVQLAYSKRPGTRWSMPSKWYRFDLGPSSEPLATIIALDTNLPSVSGGKDKKTGKDRGSLSKDEAEEQLAWFMEELEKPRAPFTIVMGHHPLYSNGSHGDTDELIEQWGELLQTNKVHAYLCGHDHDLQHLELDGLFTSFILSGGGGASTRKLDPAREVPYGRDVHGFTHLQVLKDKLIFSHHGTDGGLLHRFTKHPDGRFTIS